MIEVSGISKFYGQKKAVENLNFSINEGEIVGLLGLNGAGKSTILKVLGCFLLPSQGEAKVGAYSVTHDSHKVRQLIGYLPDRPPLYKEMTVEDYLVCLLYTSDAADDSLRVDLGGRRIIKKRERATGRPGAGARRGG